MTPPRPLAPLKYARSAGQTAADSLSSSQGRQQAPPAGRGPHYSNPTQGGADVASISRAAAIVGAAESDELGYLENRKSDLQLSTEAAWNALEDAGLRKSDVDAIFAGGNTLGLAEHMGIHPRFTDSTQVGGSLVRDTRRPRAGGHCRGLLRGCAGRSWQRGPLAPLLRRRCCGWRRAKLARRPVRDALRLHRRAHQLRHGLRPLHARVRRGAVPRGHVRGGRGDPQVGRAQPPRAHPRPQGGDTAHHVVRRLPRLALDMLAVPPARLLPGHRRRRRLHRHHAGARPRPEEAAAVDPGRGARATTTA